MLIGRRSPSEAAGSMSRLGGVMGSGTERARASGWGPAAAARQQLLRERRIARAARLTLCYTTEFQGMARMFRPPTLSLTDAVQQPPRPAAPAQRQLQQHGRPIHPTLQQNLWNSSFSGNCCLKC